jgi:hypothetical protein
MSQAPPQPQNNFSTSPLPNVADAASLAAWRPGDDPLRVVLPLAVAAAWSYADEAGFERVMLRRGLGRRKASLHQIANDAMFVCAKAYVQPLPDHGALVAFRGTEPTNVINWLADGTLQRVAFHAPEGKTAPNGWVHGGFYRNTRALWPEVVEALAHLKPDWFYITGHSYGGALALLAACLLSDYDDDDHAYGYLWPKLRGVLTFGQPMVGDDVFAKKYAPRLEGHLARFVYEHDIVPHLPPKLNGWGPSHFGQEYRSNDTGWRKHSAADSVKSLVLDNVIAVTSWFREQWAGGPLKHPLAYSWGDHAPNHYVRVSLPSGAESGSEFD